MKKEEIKKIKELDRDKRKALDEGHLILKNDESKRPTDKG